MTGDWDWPTLLAFIGVFMLLLAVPTAIIEWWFDAERE